MKLVVSMQINPESSVPSESVELKPVRESDFHQRLQLATLEGDKQDFNLVLAMLTQDAKEFDEFNLPKSPPMTDVSELEKKFFITPKPIYGKTAPEKSVQQNAWLHEGEMERIKLDLAVQPEPLVAEQYDLPSEVFDNLDLNSRKRILNESENTSDKPSTTSAQLKQLAEYRQIDVDGWFNVLQQARTLSAMA